MSILPTSRLSRPCPRLNYYLMHKIRFRIFISACLFLPIPVMAAGEASNQNTSTKVLILTQTAYEQSSFTDMILPGLRYKSGKGWWALSCNAYESEDENYQPCKISKTTLSVKRSPLFSDYRFRMGEDDTIGQTLHWQPDPPKATLLMFKPSASILTKLMEGEVPTYYPNPERGIFTKEGLMSEYLAGHFEGELILPSDIKARLLPVIVFPNKARNPTNEQVKGRHTLELRVGFKRQTLVSNNFDLSSRDYLQWAGDLDGDGKLDLLINANTCTKRSVLFLSSLAKNDELVGEAGSFDYSPMEHTEC